MNYILITIIIIQLLGLTITIIGLMRIANLIAAATNALLEQFMPIAEITENIAGLPEDFDPFQHGIKQMILEKLQQAMQPQENIPIKEYARSNDGKFTANQADTSL